MRIFVPAIPAEADYEWALPVDATGHGRLRIDTFERIAAAWSAVEMTLVREDEGRQFQLPWLGDHALVLRTSAADVVGPLVEGQAELLPLSCDDTDLWLLHAIEERDALDEDRSDIVRFPSSGRIMTIRSHAFERKALDGARCFKIPQMPAGSIFLSGEVVDAVVSAGLTGFAPEMVWKESSPPAHRRD
jgi:hypothetical protein